MKLLLTIVRGDSQCCHPTHITVLFGAYGATLSQTGMMPNCMSDALCDGCPLYEIYALGSCTGRASARGPQIIFA